MGTGHRRFVKGMVASCVLASAALSSCAVIDAVGGCSESELAATDRAAARVWQALDASAPEDGAFCDSSPYPYVGGSMDGPADAIAKDAVDLLGCRETAVEGFDTDYSIILRCEVDDDAYLLEVVRELDRYGSPGLEVGLYKR